MIPRRRKGAKRYQGRLTPRREGADYGTLAVVLEVLRASAAPLTAAQIEMTAGESLPTKAIGKEGRRNVVARDLGRELARGDASRVERIKDEPRGKGWGRTTWAVRS